MKINKIEFPTPLSEIADIENDNLDVFIELEDGFSYNVVVSTPKNLIWYMEKENLNYIPAAPPDIIVKSLTENNIIEAIKNYAQDDAFWLKLYYLSGTNRKAFDIEKMNDELDKIKKANDALSDY